MKLKKTDLFTIGAAAILLVILIVIVIISFVSSSSPSTKTVEETPTPTSVPPEESSPNPPINYDPEGQDSIMNKLQTRQPLSDQDVAAKNKILTPLAGTQGSGTVYQSSNISIYYTSDINIFQVQILTTDIDAAKKEGNDWFLSQGFSQDAICNYPVQFYVNYRIAEQLRGKDIIVNPLPPGCK